jgi:hypothetical protein
MLKHRRSKDNGLATRDNYALRGNVENSNAYLEVSRRI